MSSKQLHSFLSELIEKKKKNEELVNLYHWDMVNMKSRNAAFDEAICEAIKRFDKPTVLDIGCGSGILSVFAARTGKTKKIIACDLDHTMYTICKEVRTLNDISFELYNLSSKFLTLKEKADILVTETIDSTIFGERILFTIKDAKERHLTKDSIIIPSKATLFCGALESQDIANRSFCEFDNSVLLSSKCFSTEIKPDLTKEKPEFFYEYTLLQELPHDYRIISEATEAISVDFNNQEQVEELTRETYQKKLQLNITEDGIVHGIVTWFRLNTFGDISVCTYPETNTSNNHWQQVICPFYPPLNVRTNDKVDILLSLKNETTWLREFSILLINPIKLPKSNKKLLRENPRYTFDYIALNEPLIKEFFKKAVSGYKSIWDVTELGIYRCLNAADHHAMALTPPISLIYKLAQSHEKMNLEQIEMRMNDNLLEEETLNIEEEPEAIIFWPIGSRNGMLRGIWFNDLLRCSKIKPNACIIPSKFILYGYLFASDTILSQVRLNKDSHLGVNLTPMNKYKLSWLIRISLQKTKHQKLSDNMKLMEPLNNISDLDQLRVPSTIRVKQASEAHGILCWYKVSHGDVSVELNNSNFYGSAWVFDEPVKLEKDCDFKIFTSMIKCDVVFQLE